MPSIRLSERSLPLGADAIGQIRGATIPLATASPPPPFDKPVSPPKALFAALGFLAISIVVAAVGVSLSVSLGLSSTHIVLVLIGVIGSLASSGVAFVLWRERWTARRVQQEGVKLERRRWQVQLREKDLQLHKCKSINKRHDTSAAATTAKNPTDIDENVRQQNGSVSDNANSKAVQVSQSMPRLLPCRTQNDPRTCSMHHNRSSQKPRQSDEMRISSAVTNSEQRIEIKPKVDASHDGSITSCCEATSPLPEMQRDAIEPVSRSSGTRQSTPKQQIKRTKEKAIEKVDRWIESVAGNTFLKNDTIIKGPSGTKSAAQGSTDETTVDNKCVHNKRATEELFAPTTTCERKSSLLTTGLGTNAEKAANKDD